MEIRTICGVRSQYGKHQRVKHMRGDNIMVKHGITLGEIFNYSNYLFPTVIRNN